MRVITKVLSGLIAAGACWGACAGVLNEVPSCYKANKLDVKLPVPDREIFILVDQTTILDERLQKSVLENVWGFLGPNSSYTVVSFSAFSQGRYTEVVTAGTIEPPFPEQDRNSTSERLLKSFDACMKGQEIWAKKHATEAITNTLVASSPDLRKSDILAALKDVSIRIKASPAKSKVLFMISDMLENSSISSFYANSAMVRMIDPAKEIAAAEKADMFGAFDGAHVHVLGAGIINPAGDKRSGYRDPKTMNALNAFWKQYFEKSGAKLEQFGQPALLQAIK